MSLPCNRYNKNLLQGRIFIVDRPVGNKEIKIIRYLMLAMLLVLVFLVSAYAGRMKREQNSGKAPGGTDSAGTAENGSAAGGAGAPGSEDVAEDGNRTDAGNAGQDAESESPEPGSKGTIVLDAGHGGVDPGVSGASGVAERELNLSIAKKLEALLTKEGYRVVQTRPTEAGLYDEDQTHKKAQDMQRRCAIIEKEQPLLTASIHQNSYPDSSVSGPQVFYYAKSKEGERLASCIQSCMNEQLAVEKPKPHKGNESYYILKRSAGTAVIVECGFLTNPEEEAKLQDEAYQDKVAAAIRDGIRNYLEEYSGAQRQ